MSFCIKIPTRLKFKRFNKKYAKIKYKVEKTTKMTTVRNSPQFVCGLKAVTHGFLSTKLLHTCILLLRRSVGKGRIGWTRIRIIFNITVPVTRKSEGHRMGKGKGAVRFWGVAIKAGAFVFKIYKSPRKMFFYKSYDWTNIYAFLEWVETSGGIISSYFNWQQIYNTANIIMPKTMNLVLKSNLLFLGFTKLVNKKQLPVKQIFLFFYHILRVFFKHINDNIKTKKIHSFFLFLYYRYNIFTTTSSFGNSMLSVQLYSLLFKTFFIIFQQKLKVRLFKYNFKIFKKIYLNLLLNQSLLYVMQRKYMTNICLYKEKEAPFIEDQIQNSYLDTILRAEKLTRLPTAKLSYIPSLFRGLRRVRNRLPFKSEFFFFDERNDAFSFYTKIHTKRKRVKQSKR